MEDQGSRAGLGFVQFATAACASSRVGFLNDGSARPMAAVMLACGIAARIAFAVAQRVGQAAAPAVAGSSI